MAFISSFLCFAKSLFSKMMIVGVRKENHSQDISITKDLLSHDYLPEVVIKENSFHRRVRAHKSVINKENTYSVKLISSYDDQSNIARLKGYGSTPDLQLSGNNS